MSSVREPIRVILRPLNAGPVPSTRRVGRATDKVGDRFSHFTASGRSRSRRDDPAKAEAGNRINSGLTSDPLSRAGGTYGTPCCATISQTQDLALISMDQSSSIAESRLIVVSVAPRLP